MSLYRAGGRIEEIFLTHEKLMSVPSARPVPQLVERLEAALAARGITVFLRVDHAQGAASVAMELRPTVVVVFGDPRAGTPLMQAEQRLGLDLPLRMLAWEDAEGRRWLSYHDPDVLLAAHGLDPNALPRVAAIATLLRSLANEVAN